MGGVREETGEPASEPACGLAGSCNTAELRQLGAIDRRLRYDGQAVEKALPGGSGAPGPVLVRNTSEVVGFAAMSTCDERVAADQPARADVGQLAVDLGSGE
jgi:hypothetical protein